MTHFILNKHAHYFIVNGHVDVKKLEQCDSFDSLQKLLEAAARISDLQLDEVQGNEYEFSYDTEIDKWFETDPRGITYPLITEQTIEQYLSDWSL